jgi:uncharacterized protein (TIGR00725 family)
MKVENPPVLVAVIGAHFCGPDEEKLAYETGRIVAGAGAVLVCGGLGGVMQASARGAKEAGGLTIGLLPGKDKFEANPYIDIALPTTIGFARNAMVAASGDIIIALPGSHGTSSEISYGFVYGRPVIDLGGWKREGMIRVSDPDDLRDRLSGLIAGIRARRNPPGSLNSEVNSDYPASR